MTALPQELEELKEKISRATVPSKVRATLDEQTERLSRFTGKDYAVEADHTIRWVNWIVSLPWGERAKDSLDLKKARAILDEHHYGLDEIKERVLEYLAVLKLRQLGGGSSQASFRAPILLLVGLAGTGKTTLAYSIAQAIGRPVARIPFGGMGSARDLRGESRLHSEAEPGQVIKAVRQAGVKNPVILLDELDRVADEARHDIMGVLVELLDPEQNKSFLDHYIDIPFDLSEVLFVATANNTGNIATAVMDRLEPISLPSYTDEQKIIIAKRYLLPQAEGEAAIPPGALTIDDDVWPMIARPLGYDAGIRTLQRTIQNLARKTAIHIVNGNLEPIRVTKNNFQEYLGI